MPRRTIKRSDPVYRNPVGVNVVGAVDIFKRQKFHSRSVVRQYVCEAVFRAVALQFGLLACLLSADELQLLSTTDHTLELFQVSHPKVQVTHLN